MKKFDTSADFQTALNICLEKFNIQQKELAASINKSYSAISMYCQGNRGGDENTRREIAEYFGFSYDDFLKLGRFFNKKITSPKRKNLNQYCIEHHLKKYFFEIFSPFNSDFETSELVDLLLKLNTLKIKKFDSFLKSEIQKIINRLD